MTGIATGLPLLPGAHKRLPDNMSPNFGYATVLEWAACDCSPIKFFFFLSAEYFKTFWNVKKIA